MKIGSRTPVRRPDYGTGLSAAGAAGLQPSPLPSFSVAGSPIVPGAEPTTGTMALNAPMAAIGHAVHPDNILSRIGDFIHSDEGRAALLRSAGATLQGGLGAGIQAGTNFVDQRRAQGEDKRRFDLMQALKERGVNIDEFQAHDQSDRGWGGLANDATQIQETGRSHRANERLTARGQDVDRYGVDTRAKVDVRGQDVSRANNTDDNRTTARGQDVTNLNGERSYDASIYGSNMGVVGDQVRANAAGIGSKVPMMTVATTRPAQPARNRWFGPDEAAVPKVVTTIRQPLGAPGGHFETPTAPAIQALRDNPGLKDEFEAKFGPGSSSQYLGGR